MLDVKMSSMLTFDPIMTKTDLYRIVDGGPTKVAAIFGITKSAVSQWPDPIPEARVFELKGRRPDLFDVCEPAQTPSEPAAA